MRRLYLLLIVLLAFGLRLHQIDNFGFWQDEGLTPLRSGYTPATILSNKVTIQEGVTNDTHPPLYFLMIHYSRRAFGESDFAYRFPSALAGVLLVPLLAELGGRLAGRRVAGLAAVLAAINPALIWYGQEARMYTLVVLLVALATYALWRALAGGRLAHWFAAYGLAAALAFLTHYTAVFVIAFQAPFWVWLLWRAGHRRLLMAGLALAALIFIPFIPFTLLRLFSGAETSYSYVPLSVMLQDVVHGFGLGLTADLERPGIRLLVAGVAALLTIGLLAAGPSLHGPPRRAFLLAFLLAAPVGISLGSLIKPMYLGIRHILVSLPAFLLLLALGIEALRSRRPALAAAGLFIALAGPLLALNNLYHDPAYAKDDVRALVRAIERRAGDRDVVLYNDAILLPLHDHYSRRPDLTVTALPIYPRQAGPETLGELAELAGRFERIWFVNDPPDDGRDDAGVVGDWLEANARPLEQLSAHAQAMFVGAAAYDTLPTGAAALPAGAEALDVAWPGLPALRGWQPRFDQPAASAALWMELIWDGEPLMPPGRGLRFALVGPDGQSWLDYSVGLRPAAAAARLVRQRYGLAVPAGTPPGEYELRLAPWDVASGELTGDWRALGTITLAASAGPAAASALPREAAGSLSFANGLELLALENLQVNIRPGNSLAVAAYWAAPAFVPGARYELQLVGPDGRVWSERSGEPGPAWLGAADWPALAPLREPIGLSFPPDAPAGTYTLRWRLLQDEAPVPGRPSWRPWRTTWNDYGHIRVQPWPLVTRLPAAQHVTRTPFGPEIELYGYDLPVATTRPGEDLAITLYWRALARPQANYVAFIHLAWLEDGRIVAQQDRIPVDWLRPTQGWRPGELLTDAYRLAIPADAPYGAYALYVGLVDAANDQRAAITVDGRPVADGRLLLGQVRIEP